MEKHSCVPRNAHKFYEWCKTRGGVAVWNSVNMSNPGASWSTPARNEDGTPSKKPNWQSSNEPVRIYTLDDIEVHVPKVVKKFKIHLRMGSDGFTVKLTIASCQRISKELKKAGDTAWYEYDDDECIIFVPEKIVPLKQFIVDIWGEEKNNEQN